MKRLAAQCLILTAVGLVCEPAARAHTDVEAFRRSMAAEIRLCSTSGPLRPVDPSLLTRKVSREILAGPTTGLDSAYIIYTRRAAGTRPGGLYTLPVEQTYVVLSGKLDIQIGADRFVAAPDTLVLVPAGIAHQAWNAGAGPEADLEVVTPAPARDWVSMVKPARAYKVENAAQYVHVPPPLGKLKGGAGHAALNERVLASRATGSEYVMERLAEVLPGSRSEPAHIHPFDQAFFVRQGTMTIHYGLASYEAHANTLVVIPAGVVHSDQNGGSSVASLVQLVLPEPKPGVPSAVRVELEHPPG